MVGAPLAEHAAAADPRPAADVEGAVGGVHQVLALVAGAVHLHSVTDLPLDTLSQEEGALHSIMVMEGD